VISGLASEGHDPGTGSSSSVDAAWADLRRRPTLKSCGSAPVEAQGRPAPAICSSDSARG